MSRRPDLKLIRERAVEQLDDTLWAICSWMTDEKVPRDEKNPAFVVAFQVVAEVYGGALADKARTFYVTDYE